MQQHSSNLFSFGPQGKIRNIIFPGGVSLAQCGRSFSHLQQINVLRCRKISYSFPTKPGRVARNVSKLVGE